MGQFNNKESCPQRLTSHTYCNELSHVLKGTCLLHGPLGYQAGVGYQPGEQEAWGPWGTQGRAKIESRGPKDGFHSFKCVLGAKGSAPDLSVSAQAHPKQSVSVAFYFMRYLLQLVLIQLLAVHNHQFGGG